MERSWSRIAPLVVVSAGAAAAACSALLGAADVRYAEDDAGARDGAPSGDAAGDAAEIDAASDAGACVPEPPAAHEAGALATCSGVSGVDIAGDPRNCGACGHSCEGATCANGYCSIAYLNAEANVGFVEDGYVYWLTSEGSGVGRTAVDAAAGDQGTVLFTVAPPDGGVTAPAFVGLLAFSNAFALVAKDALYLTSRDGKFVQVVLSLNNPLSVALEASGESIAIGNDSPPTLYRVMQDGGYASLVPGARALAVAGAASGTYWLENAGAGASLHEYVDDGGIARKVVDDAGQGGPLASDGQYVFFADSSNGRIWRVRDDPSVAAAPELVSASPDYPQVVALAVDDAHVYWMADLGGHNPAIFRASKCAGSPASMMVAPDPGGEAYEMGLVAGDPRLLFFHSRAQLVRVAK